MWYFGGWAQPPPWEEQRAFGEMLMEEESSVGGEGRREDCQGRVMVLLCPYHTGMAIPVVCTGELAGWVWDLGWERSPRCDSECTGWVVHRGCSVSRSFLDYLKREWTMCRPRGLWVTGTWPLEPSL